MIYLRGCVGGFQIFSLLSLIQKTTWTNSSCLWFDRISELFEVLVLQIRSSRRRKSLVESQKSLDQVKMTIIYFLNLVCDAKFGQTLGTKHPKSVDIQIIHIMKLLEGMYRHANGCLTVFFYICLYWNVNVREYFQHQRQIRCLFRCQAWEQVTVLLFGRSYERVNVTSLSDKLVWCFILMSSWFGASWRNNVSFKSVF